MFTPFEAYFGHVEKLGGNGWLRVRFDDGLVWPIPEFLRVKVNKTGDRESFQVLEGRMAGKTATVKKKGWEWTSWDWDRSYFEQSVHLGKGCPHTGSASVTFYRLTERLEVTGLGTFNAITDTRNPTPLGSFDLEIPYEPHPGGGYYTSDSKYAKTWFRVGHSGDRFLHPGRISAGCITVTDTRQWDKIYQHLIVSRKDDQSIGTVKVVDR
ncbi:hypothetical protein ACFQ1M_07935 [Sungkyunkwania multivorans]|uniref:YkuD domain-containing protein n=1 Tax=Sungkyunkwania multivorans TaxID=1173618 RepID=A0ABW3CX83_9FLAO